MEIKFCEICTISNYRPQSCVEYKNNGNDKEYMNIENNICSACRYNKIKKDINWNERKEQLDNLLNKIKTDKDYDIIVPASGGKDSTYQAYLLKKVHNMKVLTVTWAPHIYTMPGFRNFQNMIHSIGVDNILFTPNGRVHRLLTKLAYKNLLHPFQPFILGQKNIGIKFAVKNNINTVFYGENEAEYGNDIDDNKIPFRDVKYCVIDDDESFDDFVISGIKVKDLIRDYNLTLNDLEPYLPIKKSKLNNVDIKIYYLGYFYKWDPQQVYYNSVRNCGFMPNNYRTEGSYCKYSSFDDRIDGFHYWTTFIKYGLGRCTYDTCQEIRNDKITLDEGKKLVEKYDGEFPLKFFKEFLDYIDMDIEEFFEIADKFRNPKLWEKLDDHLWKLKYTCYVKEKIDDSYFVAKKYLEENTNNDNLIKYFSL